MGPYRKIYSRIWNDQKFNALSDDGKLACFLLLTHPHLMPIGAMRATIPGLACELRWITDRFQNAFEEVASSNIVKHDEQACFIWLPNFIKYNLPTSPNVIRSWDQYLDYLPECELKTKLVQKVTNFVKEFMSEPFHEALSEVFGKDLLNQEQYQEKYQEQKKDKEILSDGTDAVCINNFSVNKTLTSNHTYKVQAIEILTLLNSKQVKHFVILIQTSILLLKF